jgi:uncharacterized protein (TIGR02646 family)
MRWISRDDVEDCLTSKWRKAAASVLDEVLSARSARSRSAILRSVRSTKVWRDFYSLLPDALTKKCWYCEAEEVRSDMPVDHFRPKSAVEGVPAHNGYWWLAYDWRNYRCSCTFCNSRRVMNTTEGGKQNSFPIFNEAARAMSSGDSVDRERPAILDPFDPTDEKALWFDDDGKPVPTPQIPKQQVSKVKNSVRIFHLDETRLVRKRNALRLEILRDLNVLRDAKQRRDQTARRTVEARLRRRVRDTTMLSRAAIVYLRPYRGEFEEVRNMLNLD